MSRALLLAPHNDDESLFAAFTCLQEKPHVIVILRSHVQEDRGYGITYQQREAETAAAMDILGCTWEQWPYPDNDPPWDAITVSIQTVIDGYTRVYAPAPEPDGHAHHNTVGEIAAAASTRVTHYMTYTPAGKSTGQPVPHTAAEMDTKLRAIACYETQAQHPSTAPHFTRDQTEYRL